MNNETSNKAKQFSDELQQLCRKFQISDLVCLAITNNGDLWPLLQGTGASPLVNACMHAIMMKMKEMEPHIPTRIHKKTPDGWQSKDLHS